MSSIFIFRQIGNRFNIADSTSHKVVIDCLNYMQNLSNIFIRWPIGQESEMTVEKFKYLIAVSFPDVLGAIDRCHISILVPWEKRNVMEKLNRNMFYNRK